MRLLAPCIAVLLLAGIVQAADPAKPAERTEAEKAAMAKLREAGALVLEVAQNDPHLEVAFHLQPANFDEASLDQVQSLKNQVVQLNLRGVKVSDAALAKLADMPALTHLHLEKTPVTDAGLVHLKGLQNLVYLNLYGTAVTDAGLGSLAGLKNLKRIYLWETKVTDAGAEALTKALPEIRIDRGLVVSIQTPVEEKKEEAKPDEKKDDKKTEEKKEEKKPDDKKAEEKKPEEKKAEEKK